MDSNIAWPHIAVCTNVNFSFSSLRFCSIPFPDCNDGEIACPVNGTVKCIIPAGDADQDCVPDEYVST